MALSFRGSCRPVARVSDLLETIRAALHDRYTIEREIGSGGMATVFLADDRKHHRRVAVKVLRPELAEALGADRFLREIKIVAGLQHPHILPLYDSGRAGGFLYYVMPYMAGPSLRARLAKGPLPIGDAVRLIRDVVDALVVAHREGVVHRDIKPDNILLSGRSAVVADFGVAKALREATAPKDATTAGMALGTPAYMAPEQAAADPNIDHRADLYAVGAVAYELLTGEPPFSGLPPQQILAAQVTQAPVPVRRRRPDCPPALEAVVMKCLAKKPGERWQTAEELLAAVEALATPSGGTTAASRSAVWATRIRGHRWLVGLAIMAAVAAGAMIARRWTAGPQLDQNLLAVAPFDVLDTSLDLWREGLVDVLSANLDGAGTLRTVAPSLVVARWAGRADAASAQRLAHSLAAGYVVFGRLLMSGADSVRLSATLLDAGSGTAVMEMEFRDDATRIDRLADSLTLGVLRELSQRQPLGAIRLTSFGASSPAALKAFLEGERFFRQSNWDSARVHYARAMQLDPNFALAYSRMASVVGWRRGGEGSSRFALQAGDLNRGLAPRESLLVTADSISAALTEFQGTAADWALVSRLFPTLQRAVNQYPEDPGGWYQLGEARYRWGPYVGIPDSLTAVPLRRAIGLDSAFTPAYLYLIPLTLEASSDEGHALITTYLRQQPSPALAQAMALVVALLDPAPRDTGYANRRMDSLPPPTLATALRQLTRSPDSAEAGIRLARRLVAEERDRGNRVLPWLLAYRGHLRDALVLGDTADAQLLIEAALLGAVPSDTVDERAAHWLAEDVSPGMFTALPWWAVRGDTSSIRRAVASWRRQLNRGELLPSDTAVTQYAIDAGDAYGALAAGDSARALDRFRRLPVWPWRDFYRERLTLAELSLAAGRVREAADILAEAPLARSNLPRPGEITWLLARARAFEAVKDVTDAAATYRFVTEVWRNADPVLQPWVAQAAAGVNRLRGR